MTSTKKLNHVKRIWLVAALLAGFQAKAQFNYVYDQSIPVANNGSTMTLPWAGAFNSPQFNTMDLNGDNQPDLVLFDRTANKVITFLNQSKVYQYAPEYEALFPPGLTQWMLLRDFNCDGKKDIFTSDPFGMRAWVNITPPGGPLKWRKFNPDFPVLTIGFTGSINLQINGTDIPGIDDIDGDGDLDILDARFVGIGSLEWQKNMSIENTGKCDSMQFQRVTQQWGKFEECDCGSFIFDGQPCSPFGGRSTHAAGKSILTLDMDNDGDRDLLFSEETCNYLYLLPNTGTQDSALMESSSRFPSFNPLNLQIFPAAYYEDVDFDNVPDLVVADNVYTRNSFYINFKQSAILYKNTGSLQQPDFTFVSNDFLQNQMIEVGDNAVPALIDADGDGDLDLFIGQYLGVLVPAGIHFYENTGTTSAPSFNFVTDDYANLSLLGFFNLKPQFADLDSDGKTDLVFTATDPQNMVTTLRFIPNQSSSKLDISGQAAVATPFTMYQPENVLVVDVNQDGINDILVGKTNGAVEYWMNNGPKGTLNFALADPAYLGLGISTDRQSVSLSVADLDADGKEDLVIADQQGVLSIYPDFRSQGPPAAMQNILFNPLTKDYQPSSLGGNIWPAVANLFNSDRPAIVVGNTMGGVYILKNDDSSELPPDPVIDLFPNPVAKGDGFTIRTDRKISVQFISVLGQKLSEEMVIAANQSVLFSSSGLVAGVYIARFKSGGKLYSRRFIIF